jgi:hypothetical protein
MRGLDEADLVRIREAFEKDSLTEAIRALETTLEELGYRRTERTCRDDRGLAGIMNHPVAVLAA